MLPVISLYIDILIRTFQYNFFPTPADVLFKNKDYFIYSIQEKGANHNYETSKKKIGEDSYSPLKVIDNSKVINEDKINQNINFGYTDKTFGIASNQIQFDSPDRFAVRRKTEISDPTNEKFTNK